MNNSIAVLSKKGIEKDNNSANLLLLVLIFSWECFTATILPERAAPSVRPEPALHGRSEGGDGSIPPGSGTPLGNPSVERTRDVSKHPSGHDIGGLDGGWTDPDYYYCCCSSRH